MAHFDIAMVALKQDSYYLMQKRVPSNDIGAAGLIGFFGGKIEQGESAAEAACREVAEETNIVLKPAQIEPIGEVNIIMDHPHGKDTTVNAQVFGAEIKDQDIEAKEGVLVRFTKPDAWANIDKLTPATKAAFKELLSKGDQ